MDQLDVYEEKTSKYLSKMKFSYLPLISWDVHMMNFTAITQLQKDILELKRITDKLKIEVDPVEELVRNHAVIVITDINLVIEYASSNMVNMSGYMPEEIIGNSPKMFQGTNTDKVLADKIRTYVNNEEFFEATLINYKKDNSEYNCHIKGFPVFNKEGNLVKYVAIEHAA